MQKITPFLWFDSQAEEAANFYVETFKNAPKGSSGDSRVLAIARYGQESVEISGKPAGSVMTVSFMVDGLEMTALNGGPIFTFSEAVSLAVNCDSQNEIDYFWNAFTKNGGQESQCGWCKDKFGFSWQIVPAVLTEIMSSKDTDKAHRAMAKLMTMKKLVISELESA